MSIYFYLLDGEWFETVARPALTAAWRRRSFRPCANLCQDLLPSARAYTVRYHIPNHEPFLATAAATAFDRFLWRYLVGEVLLYGARELPELPTTLSTLCWLTIGQLPVATRSGFSPMQQLHLGSRELTFGPTVYRPEKAGWNTREDIARLDQYLRNLRPELWTTADLAGFVDTADEEDRADELQLARDTLTELAVLFSRARESGAVLVHEELH
jgi:hypothetical protein